MFQINWKTKAIIFKFLNFFKLYKTLFFIQKKITKRSEVNFKEIVYYWDYHFKYLKENSSKSLLEIGAGKSLAQNIYLSYKFNQKIEQTLIVVSKMLDLELFNKANEQISKIIGINKLPFVRSISDLEKNYNIKYIAPMDLKQLSENNIKFDASISSTTLEHLPKEELKENFILLRKIIKKNGIISSLVDYSDHYSHTDQNIDNLNFLKFSSKEWKKYNTPMLFQNRLRHQDYRELFKTCGYKVSEIKGDLGEQSEYISKEFDSKNEETFILWGHFLLQL